MCIVDRGSGPPVVVIPGIQGRWEWMKPGIDALASRCRVVTYSLCDEPSCGHGGPSSGSAAADEAAAFTCYVEQVGEAMDEAGLESATVCGVSFGGLVAAAFAARHPERVRSLVLVSALPPSWTPDARARFYLRAPRLLAPLFVVASLRLYREIAAAHPGLLPGLRQASRHGWNVARHRFSPSRMARRVRSLAAADLSGLRSLRVPALVVTGEPHLDRVVPVRATREYLDWLPDARAAVVERTGHLGVITRPEAFADLVAPFAAAAGGEGGRRRLA